jgi:hypothetical protein
MKSFPAVIALIALLVAPVQCVAAGLGWYYESFSWPALQDYFGGGTTTRKIMHREHLKALLERERADPYYNIKFGPRETKLWEKFIADGIQYDRLSRPEAKFADKVIGILMGPEAGVPDLDLQSHTDPDYIHSAAFRHLMSKADPKTRAFLKLFRYGRSYGQSGDRSECPFEGEAWTCNEAYVVFSPTECSIFGKQLTAILDSTDFMESEFEERTFVAPLAKALVAAGDRQRGMYLRSTD